MRLLSVERVELLAHLVTATWCPSEVGERRRGAVLGKRLRSRSARGSASEGLISRADSGSQRWGISMRRPSASMIARNCSAVTRTSDQVNAKIGV